MREVYNSIDTSIPLQQQLLSVQSVSGKSPILIDKFANDLSLNLYQCFKCKFKI